MGMKIKVLDPYITVDDENIFDSVQCTLIARGKIRNEYMKNTQKNNFT